MNIYEWFFVGIGIAGFLYTWRLTFFKIAWGYNHYPDLDNVCGGFIFGFLAAIVWPLTLLCIGIQNNSLRYFVVERLLPLPEGTSREDIVRRRR